MSNAANWPVARSVRPRPLSIPRTSRAPKKEGVCDDYDEIAAWGAAHREFLRGFAEFYFGTPGEDWLRPLMNRIDPELFTAASSAGRARCQRMPPR